MNEKLTSEQIIEIIEESMFDCYPQWRNLTPSDLPIVAEKIASLINTTEDERYQTALEVQAEYLKELNKYSKEKSWEEGQSQSGLFMWLGMKLQQEDE